MRALQAWTYAALTALLILGVSIIGLRSPRPAIDIRSLPMITHAGGLTPSSPPGELFWCRESGLHQIDVPFVAIGRTRHSRLTLKLRANSPEGVVLREVTLTPNIDQTGPAWVAFEFEPIEESSDKVFHFSVEPADEAATNLSPWVRFHGQTGMNTPWGDRFLTAGSTQKGDFISAHANLRSMAFPVESLFPGLETARLALYESPSSEEPLRVSALKSYDEVHAGWAFFSFEPLPDSRWRRYYFELKTPEHCRLIGSQNENQEDIPVYKTFHGVDVTDSPLMGLTRGVSRQPDRDLVFRAWCDDPPSAVFARLNERTGGKLWLAALLWLAATAICLRVFVFLDPSPEPEAPTTNGPPEEGASADPAAAS